MAEGIGPGTTAMYMQRTTSGAAGNGLYTTTKYMRGALGIGMGTTIKHLRRTTSGAAGNGLGATMKYLRCTTSAAANNGLSTTIIPPYSAASFEVNLESHTGARPSVRLCVGPELARCVHYKSSISRLHKSTIRVSYEGFKVGTSLNSDPSCNRNSMVSKSWKLRFGLCHDKRPDGYTVLMKSPLIANGAKIPRIGGFVKIAKIERKVQARR
jgi:hypothetical protein